jgi:hypothetical protein
MEMKLAMDNRGSRKLFTVTALLCLLAGLGTTARADGDSQLEAREREMTVNATAEVTAIDHAKRQVTLKGPEGNEVTVIAGDQVNKTITVQGPLGGLLTAPVRDPNVLATLKIGDTLVLTYTEAVALSLEKVERR